MAVANLWIASRSLPPEGGSHRRSCVPAYNRPRTGELMTGKLIPALLVTRHGRIGCDPAASTRLCRSGSRARCGRQGHRHREPAVCDDLGHGIRGRRRPATRVGAQRRLAESRRVGELHADDGLGTLEHEGGVRSPARIEPGGVEVRCPLDRRPAPAGAAPGLHRQGQLRLADGRTGRGTGGLDAGPRGNLPARLCG